jgi:hypothetical protein
MTPDALAFGTVYSGLIGLSLWFVAIADSMYRINLPRTHRSAHYDRIASVFVGVGSLFVLAFVGGLYSLVNL